MSAIDVAMRTSLRRQAPPLPSGLAIPRTTAREWWGSLTPSGRTWPDRRRANIRDRLPCVRIQQIATGVILSPVMSTQKTAWLIVACCLLLFASEGLAQEELPDPPRWYVNREIDPITDKKRVFTSLRGRIVDTMTRDGAITGVPTLSISCNTRGTWFVRSPQGDLYPELCTDSLCECGCVRSGLAVVVRW